MKIAKTVNCTSLPEYLVRRFKRELGKEGSVSVAVYNCPAAEGESTARIIIHYMAEVVGNTEVGEKSVSITWTVDLAKVPMELTRASVRFGATRSFMRRLRKAYDSILDEILALRGCVGHDELHADNPGYDL